MYKTFLTTIMACLTLSAISAGVIWLPPTNEQPSGNFQPDPSGRESNIERASKSPLNKGSKW